MAEQLTPQTPDLEVWCSSLVRHVVSLDKEFYSTLSLFTQVYKKVNEKKIPTIFSTSFKKNFCLSSQHFHSNYSVHGNFCRLLELLEYS